MIVGQETCAPRILQFSARNSESQLVLVPGRKCRGRPPRKDKLDQGGKIVQNIYETNKYNYYLQTLQA